MPPNSQEALAQLQQTQATAQNPNDILANQRQQLGYQGAQDTVTGLRGAINNTTKMLKQVAPSVMGRTANSLVTNAQANKQISNEQAPISQNLTEQTTNLNDADRSLSEINQRAQEAASGIYQGQQDKMSYLQNVYNSLYQREQAAEAQRQAEMDRQESIRQFNEQLNASKKASSGGGLGGVLGGSTANKAGAQAQADAANKQRAAADVNSVLNKSNLGSYIVAVTSSAAKGNALDGMKLELLRSAKPGLFKADGSPDVNRLKALGYKL